ncbi:hypothetical protein V6N12_057422 [Hibiscus sabdariffa]|uniref:Uncharacterized protein n=1 Tax=Hibiscus sabdariffa TaxID=183260 RepID=A0ABR2C525_9ROSI
MSNTSNPHTQSLSLSNTADRGDNNQSGQPANSGEQVPHNPAANQSDQLANSDEQVPHNPAANQSNQPANSGEQVLHTPAADSYEMEAPATDSTEMDPLVADSFEETSQNSPEGVDEETSHSSIPATELQPMPTRNSSMYEENEQGAYNNQGQAGNLDFKFSEAGGLASVWDKEFFQALDSCITPREGVLASEPPIVAEERLFITHG